jgi:hypothetical protein
MDLSLWRRGTLYPQKWATTSPTSGGRSVGIVRSQTQTMEFFFKTTKGKLLNELFIDDWLQIVHDLITE